MAPKFSLEAPDGVLRFSILPAVSYNFRRTEVANEVFQSLSQFIPISCQTCPNRPERAEPCL
jgi:hypothetical protein